MLAGKRSLRVGDQLLKEIASLLMRRVKDPRVKGVTLTGIEVSSDLKHAKIFFSLLGDNEAIKQAKAGMESARGFIKREIGLRMDLKYVPDILFKYDPTLQKGTDMEMLFEKLKKEESMARGD